MPYRFFFPLLAVLLTFSTALAATLPSAFDLRDIDGRSYIGLPRDQGQCGSCWSFGALAAAESAWNRAQGVYDAEAIDLSEAFMVWSLSPLYGDLYGCDGASSMKDPMTAVLEYGVPREIDFPYTIADPGEDLHWDAPRYTMEDWHAIPVNDIETTRRVLQAIGAVTITAHSGRDAWYSYESGIFEDDLRAPTSDTVATLDHMISLVGWNDAPADGGMGYWIVRNSWGDQWGEDGYMRVRYTTSGSNLQNAYFIAEPWSGESIQVLNDDTFHAETWHAGGTLNAHGVDLWGGAASSVTNRGQILAEAVSDNELTTARGVYLWGGPEGSVANDKQIAASAYSQNAQAFSYGVILQGGLIDNRGTIEAYADSGADFAMAYGVWAANGKNGLKIDNSGDVFARSGAGTLKGACGIWSESHGLTEVGNNGTISAHAGDGAYGVSFFNGPGLLVNSGTILAQASSKTSQLQENGGWGVVGQYQTAIINSGTISGTSGAILTHGNSRVTLATGSDLRGPVFLHGGEDTLLLTGTGHEDDIFNGAETVVMNGLDWSLSGNSDFDTIAVVRGRFSVDGALTGDTSVHAGGILGGNGRLTGNVASSGVMAPGRSVGHLTIDGDFVQTAGGVLAIEIGNNAADLLTVTGTAEIAGTLSVLPDGYTNGGRFTFLEAGAVSGTFDTLESVAVLDATSYLNLSGNLTLDVTRNSYTRLAIPHNRQLAATLDSLRPTAAGDLETLLNGLDLAADAIALNAGMASLTPRIHGFATAATLGDNQARLADLRHRLDALGPTAASGDTPGGQTALWADVPAGYNRYHAEDAYFGVNEKRYGLMLGIERSAPTGVTVGMAAALSDSDYASRDTRDEGERRSYQGYLYGSWRNPGLLGGFQLGGVFGAGQAELTADRFVDFAGRSAHSQHDGRLYSASVQGRYHLRTGDWRIWPTIGASYMHLREEGFRESGAGSAGLEIDSRQDHSLQSVLGGSLERAVTVAGILLEPVLQIEWRHEFAEDSEPLRSRLLGGGEYFTTPGRDLAGDTLLLGTSLKARFSPMAFGAVSYELRLQDRDGYTGHALRLQLRVAF